MNPVEQACQAGICRISKLVRATAYLTHPHTLPECTQGDQSRQRVFKFLNVPLRAQRSLHMDMPIVLGTLQSSSGRRLLGLCETRLNTKQNPKPLSGCCCLVPSNRMAGVQKHDAVSSPTFTRSGTMYVTSGSAPSQNDHERSACWTDSGHRGSHANTTRDIRRGLQSHCRA